MRAAQAALLAAAAAAFLALAAALGRGASMRGPTPLALLASLAATIWLRSALGRLEQKFLFSDWRHADH